MIRPIQVAPLSQTRLVSQSPIVPNQMTQDEYLRRQLGTPGPAPITPAMATRLASPATAVPTATATAAQGLQQLGQAGQQQAERISKQVTKSPGVTGLLGGAQGPAGLLSDISGQADLQGLFATLTALGRPVRRGEDRLLGAVEYGQQVQQAQQQAGMQNLTNQLKLEEMQRAREIADARRKALEGMTTPAATDIGQVFTEYEIQQMSDAQKTLASQSEQIRQKGLQLLSVDPTSQVGKELLDQSEKLRSNALTGIRTRQDQAQEEKNLRTELAPSLKQANEVASKHNSLIALTDKAMQGSFVTGYGAVVQALKALEPNSAVLSSEYDSATSLAGLLSQAIQLFEGAKGTMTREMAQSLRDVASAAADTAMEVRSSIEDQYAPIVTENFLRPEQVFLKPIPLREVPTVYDFAGAAADEDRKNADKAVADDLINEFGSGA